MFASALCESGSDACSGSSNYVLTFSTTCKFLSASQRAGAVIGTAINRPVGGGPHGSCLHPVGLSVSLGPWAVIFIGASQLSILPGGLCF